MKYLKHMATVDERLQGVLANIRKDVENEPQDEDVKDAYKTMLEFTDLVSSMHNETDKQWAVDKLIKTLLKSMK